MAVRAFLDEYCFMGRRPSPTTPPAKTRAIAVQLPKSMVQQLDQLAAKSGLTRHRYMIRVLEEAVSKDITIRMSANFTGALEQEIRDKTP